MLPLCLPVLYCQLFYFLSHIHSCIPFPSFVIDFCIIFSCLLNGKLQKMCVLPSPCLSVCPNVIMRELYERLGMKFDIEYSISFSIGLLTVPQPCRLIVRLQRHERPLAGKGGTTGEKWPVILPTNGEFHAIWRDFLHATWDLRLDFPSEGRRAEDLFALKNPTASGGFEHENLGTRGQHASPKPPKPLWVQLLCVALISFCSKMVNNDGHFAWRPFCPSADTSNVTF
jgi:hypothetical protein